MNTLKHYFKDRVKLFTNPAFRLYLLNCIASTFGNGMCHLVFTWLVIQYQGTMSSVAILMGCYWLPHTLLSPLAGAIADRYNRKKIVAITVGARGLLLGIFWLMLYHTPHSLTIYAIALMQGILFALYYPATLALVREIVPENDLLYANATIDTAYEVGNVAGMGAVGLIIAATSLQTTFLLTSLCFLSACLFIYLMPHVYHEKQKITSVKKNIIVSLFKEYKQSLDYLWQRKSLLYLYSVQLLLLVSYMTAPIVLAPFAKQVLHTNVTQFGAIEASLSIGAIMGGVLAPLLVAKRSFEAVLFSQLIILGAAYFIFSINQQLLVSDLLYFIIGFCFSAWPLVVTKAQSQTDLTFQGRVQSTFTSLSGIIIVFVYSLLYLTGDKFKIQHIYWLEVVFAMIALIFLHKSLKTKKTVF